MLQYLALHFQDLISCVSVVRDEAELFNAWRIDFLILPVKFEENKKVNLHLRRDIYSINWRGGTYEAISMQVMPRS